MTRRPSLLASIVVVVAAGVAALAVVERSSPLDTAIAHLGDEDRFGTSTEAGQTVADISTHLRAEGSECREHDGADARCAALLSAAGFTAVAAVSMLDCTAPDIYDARVALARYLRAVRDFIDDGAPEKGQGAAPAIPKVVTC